MAIQRHGLATRWLLSGIYSRSARLNTTKPRMIIEASVSLSLLGLRGA